MTGATEGSCGLKAEWECVGSGTTCYILAPEATGREWLCEMAAELKANMVSVSGYAWNDSLTPWHMEAVTKYGADFGGHAGQFLIELKELCLRTEREMEVGATRRVLTGVSLSGLFAAWAMAQGEFFADIVSISGSFWYEGFADWLDTQDFPGTGRRAYLSVGEKESRSRNKYFRTVGERTRQVGDRLSELGVAVRVEQVAGDHCADTTQRMERGLRNVLDEDRNRHRA